METPVQPEISTDEPGLATFPAELANVFVFATFNALSFQIVLGSPMILYAKSLDASATVLGIIAGMMPLLVIFQIPAAAHIARVGYKNGIVIGLVISAAGSALFWPLVEEMPWMLGGCGSPARVDSRNEAAMETSARSIHNRWADIKCAFLRSRVTRKK